MVCMIVHEQIDAVLKCYRLNSPRFSDRTSGHQILDQASIIIWRMVFLYLASCRKPTEPTHGISPKNYLAKRLFMILGNP